jgi:hypothetical protein
LNLNAKGTGTVRFQREPRLNMSLGTQEFAVSCQFENTGVVGTNVHTVCYSWTPFPLPYATTPSSVVVAAGAATGGASNLTAPTIKRTGFLARWQCATPVGQCGFLNASYTVTE